jgi:predicted nucleic acid-binding Zn ribbon protein
MPFRKKTEEEKSPVVFHCVICQAAIDADRVRRKAVTCSEAHATDLKNARRRLRDTERCRLCNRPSTAAERAEYTQWRKEKRAEQTALKKAERKRDKESTEGAPDVKS